uniref:Uncharacterized protein n=1 Tax=Cyclophora tenuis TaxID=216820 RepID=A0A7S1GMH0_CYCTE|mmetsp:Transcript_22815/g.38815  ORF Transcript_22815/g.38815 Transcript_22815/m.38815 type:complete len:194 (+) Transcript_22815:94-675(+)
MYLACLPCALKRMGAERREDHWLSEEPHNLKVCVMEDDLATATDQSAGPGTTIGTTIDKEDDESFQWTPTTVIQSLVLFVIAGFAEIVGGWLVWVAIRGQQQQQGQRRRRPWWFAVVGSIVLILYGFIPCLQPTDSFGRIYAAYGGFFIVLSFLLGWALDGDRPDLGDIIGGSIALVGVILVLFWPRQQQTSK